MMITLALALVLTQDSAAVQAREVRFGQLRHVQLLEPRGEVARFATQVELGTKGESWPEARETCIAVFEGDSTEPVEELVVGTSLVRPFTWTQRPYWSLLELGESKRLVVFGPRRRRQAGEVVGRPLRVLSFPSGDEVASFEGIQEIEDARVHAGKADLLLRAGHEIQWLRLSDTGEVVGAGTVDLGLDTVACAVFEREIVGKPLRAWGVGWRGEELFAVPFVEGGADLDRAFRVTFDGGSTNDVLNVREPLRASAWTFESSTHLAISWPQYRYSIGKLQVIDVSAEPKKLWEGRPDPERNGDTSDHRQYGKALAFVPDADEDGVPDVLVTGPGCFETFVDLLSGRTGEVLKRWSPGGFAGTGHSLSLSRDSSRVLVGGTMEQNDPENLAHEGQAHWLDVIRMEPLQTWKLPLRDR